MEYVFQYTYTYNRLYRRYFRKKGVNSVFGEQVEVLSCPGAVAQPVEQQKRIPLRMIREKNPLKKEVAWGSLKPFLFLLI